MQEIVRVLYVEDDKGTAQLLRNRLSGLGCVVTVANDGHNALELLHSQSFDVLLIDHTLGDMSGLDVMEEVRKIFEMPPVMIMVTGTGDEYIAVEALKSGADDYLVKDIDGTYMLLLVEVIKSAMERRDLKMKQVELVKEQTRLIEDLKAFSYTVAHDLKQPLAHFSTALGLLERYIQAGNQEGIETKIGQLYKSISKMDTTIDALILLSHVRESSDIERENLNMGQIVWQVIEQLEGMIQEKGAVISVKGQLPMATGYQPWVEEIWMNYLTNAIKYGGNPPIIEVGASPRGENEILFWVRDNGTGISAEEQGKVFLPFSRLQERGVQGHGLGLAIVNMIAQKLGSELLIESEPGKGSTFGFTLPAIGKEASKPTA